jgi:hypothetical protein
MDFPVFLNKWISSNKLLKYTIFWYWYRLINHSGWRMDDHQRYADFWLNLNHGYDHMNYVHKFEEFWGKGSYPPEKIIIPKENFDRLVERLNAPPDPEAQKRLLEILSKPAPWDKNND